MTLVTGLALLRAAYPKADFPDRTIRVYGEKLSGIDPDLLLAAISRIIDRSKFLPTIAEVKAECADIVLNLPTQEEAWEIAERGSLRHAPEPVRTAAEYVGGRWTILHSDNIATVRAQFRKAYESARDQAVRDWISPRPEIAGMAPPELLGATVRALPETERFRPRPTMERLMRRWAQMPLDPPSEEEKADAIAVLGDIEALWSDPVDDPLYCEAERIFAEGSA